MEEEGGRHFEFFFLMILFSFFFPLKWSEIQKLKFLLIFVFTFCGGRFVVAPRRRPIAMDRFGSRDTAGPMVDFFGG